MFDNKYFQYEKRTKSQPRTIAVTIEQYQRLSPPYRWDPSHPFDLRGLFQSLISFIEERF